MTTILDSFHFFKIDVRFNVAILLTCFDYQRYKYIKTFKYSVI